jgi:hypothetical protein
MNVEVIRCWIRPEDGTIQGEYLVDNGDEKELVYQNGRFIRIIKHSIDDAMILYTLTQEAKDAVIMASIDYLKNMQ